MAKMADKRGYHVVYHAGSDCLNPSYHAVDPEGRTQKIFPANPIEPGSFAGAHARACDWVDAMNAQRNPEKSDVFLGFTQADIHEPFIALLENIKKMQHNEMCAIYKLDGEYVIIAMLMGKFWSGSGPTLNEAVENMR